MDPKIGGRFLSVDPVAADNVGGNFNRYWYANNNPYKFKDPDGRFGRDFDSISKEAGTYLKTPPRSDKDWLGPAIGVSLAVVAAPAVAFGGWEAGMAALANPATANAVGIGVAEVAAGTSIAAKGGLGPVLKGEAGVAQSAAAAAARGEQVLGKEITLTAGRVTTRPDLLVRKPDGALKFIESKCGSGACLTPNQRAGFPTIEAGGAVPRGGNAAAAGLQPGQPLGPTEVQVDWWP